MNRWPYGYMRYYYLPNDAAFWPEGPTPTQIGAAPFGRFTFGTTDAANHGFCEGAMNKAYEAVTHIRETGAR